MTRKIYTKIAKQLSNENSRFNFYSDSPFAEELVDIIESKHRALLKAKSDLECILGYMKKHQAGNHIAWGDVCADIGSDIEETIKACEDAITKDSN